MTHEQRILMEINRHRHGTRLQRLRRWMSNAIWRLTGSRLPQIKDAIHVI